MENPITVFVRHLWRDESGATAIEYGLIASLIAVAVIPPLQDLAQSIFGPGSALQCAQTLLGDESESPIPLTRVDGQSEDLCG